MSATLTGTYDSRTQAELAIEHLVQEIGIERADIFVSAEGPDNSAGTAVAGADGETVGRAARKDAPLFGQIIVSIDLQDDARATEVAAALNEFEGGM